MSFHIEDVPASDTPEFEEALDAAFYAHRGVEPPAPEPESGGSEDSTPAPADEAPGQWEPGVEPFADEAPEVAPPEQLEEGEPVQPPPPSGWEIAGRQFEEDEGERLRQVYEWVETMDPDFARAIGLLASGEYTLAPVSAPTDTPPAPAVDPFEGLEEYAAPEVIQLLRDQREQMARLESQLQDVSQSSRQANDYAAREMFERDARSAMDAFGERYGIEGEFLDEVSRASARNLAMFAGTADSAYSAFDQSLEHTLWTTPKFRAMIQSNDARRLADETAEIQTHIDEKKRVQSAIASATGSVPRSEPTPRNLTHAERRDAMVREVQEYLNQP